MELFWFTVIVEKKEAISADNDESSGKAKADVWGSRQGLWQYMILRKFMQFMEIFYFFLSLHNQWFMECMGY